MGPHTQIYSVFLFCIFCELSRFLYLAFREENAFRLQILRCKKIVVGVGPKSLPTDRNSEIYLILKSNKAVLFKEITKSNGTWRCFCCAVWNFYSWQRKLKHSLNVNNDDTDHLKMEGSEAPGLVWLDTGLQISCYPMVDCVCVLW